MPGVNPTDADREAAARAVTIPADALEKMRVACVSTTSSSEAATACRLLATLHAEGMSGFARDAEQARRLFERSSQHLLRACDAGDYQACAVEGGMNAMKLRTLDPSSARAKEWAGATIPLLDKACRAGVKRCCGDLADIYEVGRGIGRDRIKATAYRVQSEPSVP